MMIGSHLALMTAIKEVGFQSGFNLIFCLAARASSFSLAACEETTGRGKLLRKSDGDFHPTFFIGAKRGHM